MKSYEILLLLAVAFIAIGAGLIHPALAFLVVGVATGALGLALAREPEPTKPEQAEGLDALITASPES